ncbi:MAG TPA: ABC transporter permease [Clostridia bacterium]|nr:ABC transporter permease [Clostridia bacterium]
MAKNKTIIRDFLAKNIVIILFLLISGIAIPYSQYSGQHLVQEVVTRLGRDSFLVLALLLPVMAGMGINFGLALGAFSGQIALILVTSWQVPGVAGMFLAMALSAPISILLGSLAGAILNRAKGREMITSFVLGFFMTGIYQFVVIICMGSIIPIHDPNNLLLLSKGFGVRNAIQLTQTKGAFDMFFDKLLGVPISIGGVHFPLFSFVIIGVLCGLTVWFRKTKMGQEMRAIGQDMGVSATAGINVDKTRIIAMIVSTTLAGFGQLISIQNIGTLSTYAGTDSLALYAAAALLVGGATVNKASIPNVFIGTALFHLMFIVMPLAANNILGSAVIGEYSRTFISYTVVAASLVLHAWNRNRDKERERLTMSNHG